MFDKSSGPDVSVIIPAYNEERSISEVLQRLFKMNWPLDRMEIIVVDDGSTDNTVNVVAMFPSVKLFRHEKNKGKGYAIRTGIEASTGKVIIIQDADLEYRPEHIPELVKPIVAGEADVVFGSRFKGHHQGMSLSHLVGNKILSLVMSLLYNVRVTDVMTGHKAFRREVFDSFELNEDGFGVEVELASKCLENGWRFTEVPIDYSYRSFGVSKIVFLDGVKSLVRLVISTF